MIKKNNKDVGFIYKNNANIDKIYKGTQLVFEQGFIREDSGNTPLTTSHQAIGKDLKDYRLYGNSVQNGTPTPTNPVEIESVGDKTKNLFDKNDVEGGYINNNTGALIQKTTDIRSASSFIEIPSGTTSLYITRMSSANWGAFYDENKNYISGINGYRSTAVPNNAKYLRITIETASLDTMQVEVGTEETAYEPYGYKIPITVSGKNLFDPNATYQYTSVAYRYIDLGIDDIVTISFIDKDTSVDISDISIGFFKDINDSSKGFVWNMQKGVVNTNRTTNVTTSAAAGLNASILAIYPKTDDAYNRLLQRYNIQIEKGLSATSYEAYINPVDTTIVLDEPLRKIGDYADYLDFKNSKVVRNIKEVKLDGTENWVASSVGGGRYYLSGLTNSVSSSDYYNIYCSHLVPASWENTDNVCSIYNKSIFRARISVQSTVTDFKTWLASNNMIVDYPLETATEESITLPNIATLKGTTIFNTNTDIQPSNMYVKYKGK